MPGSLPHIGLTALCWAPCPPPSSLPHVGLSVPCWDHCPMPRSLPHVGLTALHQALCPMLCSLPHTELSAPHHAVSAVSLGQSSSRAQPSAGSADPALCFREREMGGLEIPSEQKRGVLGSSWRIPPRPQTAPALAGDCRLALCLA